MPWWASSPRLGFAGHDAHRLERERLSLIAGRVRRHQAHEPGRAGWDHHVAQRRVRRPGALRDQHLDDRALALVGRQRGMDVGVAEHEHVAHLKRLPETRALVHGQRVLDRVRDRLQMLGPSRADHDLRDPLVAQQPRERHGRHRDAPLPSELLKPVELGERRLGSELRVGLGPLGHPRPSRVGPTAPVLAGQPATAQGAVDGIGDLSFCAQRQQLRLIAAPQQRVLVLNGDRIAGGERLRQLLGVEVAHPVAADPARALVLLPRPRSTRPRRVCGSNSWARYSSTRSTPRRSRLSCSCRAIRAGDEP